MKIFVVLLLLSANFGPLAANAHSGWALVPLHPVDAPNRKALDRVTARAEQKRLKNVQLFEKQSFKLVKDRISLGVFVTGRGIAPNDKTSSVRFITIVEPYRRPNLLLTLKGGNDGVPLCAGPKAVGIVDSASSV